METASIKDILNIDVDAELARRHHLEFMKLTWAKYEPLIIGHHTKAICERIDQAVADYRKGKSTFLIITVPFRHGKSDIISRYFPPHFLGEFPNNEVMVATYAADHANGLSRFARDSVLSSKNFYRCYPDTQLAEGVRNVQNWKTTTTVKEGTEEKIYTGETHWMGVGGGSTGKGYNLGILDDYLKNRQDAESELIRDGQWAWLRDVFLTRRAPVSITIILCTPWHVDDIIGRIEKQMKKDPKFPQFTRITYPAFSEDYPTGTLFPERFSFEWYEGQRATLQAYGTASLMQCNPVIKGGAVINTSKFQYIDLDEVPEGLPKIRMWDLASSEKHLEKDDPDYTAGGLYAIDFKWNHVISMNEAWIYLIHMRRMREKAPQRNKNMIEQAGIDSADVRIGVESVAGYKDTFDIMDAVFEGVRTVEKVTVSKDKRSRISEVEPIVEAKRFFVVRGEWNQAFVDECDAFPNGKHDDQVDTMPAAHESLKTDVSFTDDDKIIHKKREQF